MFSKNEQKVLVALLGASLGLNFVHLMYIRWLTKNLTVIDEQVEILSDFGQASFEKLKEVDPEAALAIAEATQFRFVIQEGYRK